MKYLGTLLVLLMLAVISTTQLYGQGNPFAFSKEVLVTAEKPLIITKRNNKIVTRKFVMEDNAKVIFAPGVTEFYLNAEEAYFGNNTLIDGNGKSGNDGAAGQGDRGRSEPGNCATGLSGLPGGHATAGTNGVNLYISIGLSKVGSVRITSNGGTGGRGGNGGNGDYGTRGDCGSMCNGGNGGRGGNGGNAGQGGNGGTIEFNYAFLNTGMDLGGFTFSNEAGGTKGPGEGGKGGKPGSKKKSGLHCNRSGGKYMGNGNAGADANPGKKGLYLPKPAK